MNKQNTKSILVALVALAAVAGNAQATSPVYPYLKTDLRVIELDAYTKTLDVQPFGGQLTQTVKGDKIALRIDQGHACINPQQPCNREVVDSNTYVLPVVEKHIGICGVQTVVARKDYRPVDGPLLEVSITDSRTLGSDGKPCPALIHFPAVVTVQFKHSFVSRTTGEESTYIQTFGGDETVPSAFSEELMPRYKPLN